MDNRILSSSNPGTGKQAVQGDIRFPNDESTSGSDLEEHMVAGIQQYLANDGNAGHAGVKTTDARNPDARGSGSADGSSTYSEASVDPRLRFRAPDHTDFPRRAGVDANHQMSVPEVPRPHSSALARKLASILGPSMSPPRPLAFRDLATASARSTSMRLAKTAAFGKVNVYRPIAPRPSANSIPGLTSLTGNGYMAPNRHIINDGNNIVGDVSTSVSGFGSDFVVSAVQAVQGHRPAAQHQEIQHTFLNEHPANFIAAPQQYLQPPVLLESENYSLENFTPPAARSGISRKKLGPHISGHGTRVEKRAARLAPSAQPAAGKLYLDDLSNAVPVTSHWPVSLCVSILEALTFAPNSFQIPALGHRAIFGGWSYQLIATVILHARGRLATPGAYLRTVNRLKYQVRKNEEIVLQLKHYVHTNEDHAKLLQQTPPTFPYNAANWAPRSTNPYNHDPTLADMAGGVTVMPTGNDAWFLTRAVQYDQQNPRTDGHGPRKLSEVPAMAASMHWQIPAAAQNPQCDANSAKAHAHLVRPIPSGR